MRVGYIKQSEIPLKIIDKIKSFFYIITVKSYNQNVVFKVHTNGKILNNEKNMKRIIKSLFRQIQKNNLDTLVFSECEEIKCIKDKIYEMECIRILDGKELMRYMKFDIFKYILNLQKKHVNQEDIYFLIKKDSKNMNLHFLMKFIKNCRTVNIVTDDISRFKKMQEDLYQKEGILISVSNNKNKSLRKAKYIFNINMEKNDIEKFKINREAIIVNFNKSIKYNVKTFDGINVNYFKVKVPDEYIEQFEMINENNEFDETKLYESILLQKNEDDLEKIVDNIKKDEIKISKLIGNNGTIDEKEIIRKQLNLI